mgnify:CR=1 FL=1
MISLKLPSPLLIAAAITTILIIHILHKYFVRPYFLLQRYKKYKGGLCIYRPLVGTIREIKTSEKKYGDAAYDMKKRVTDNPSLRFVASTVLDTTIVTLHDNDLIKEYLNKETLVSVKFTGILGLLPEFAKHSLVFSEGEKWKRLRKLLSQVFHFDYMNNSLPTIRKTAQEWIERNCKSSSSSPRLVNVSKELKMYTSTVIWRIFFGENSFTGNDDAAPIVEMLLGHIKTARDLSFSVRNFIFGARIFKLGLRPIERRFMKNQKIIKDLFFAKLNQLKEEVNEKKKLHLQTEAANVNNFQAVSSEASKPAFRNLIELLLEQSDRLSDIEIVSQVFVFFLAGTEATSELLAISHYLLTTHPDVQAKLREEILTHIEKTENITYEHISKMEYLNAVVKEALRIGAPAINVNFRIATQDFILHEIEIKKGTVITASLIGAAYNPKFFSNPEEFRPERWIEKVDHGTIETSTHLPFSAGSRRCIGEQLALLEAKVMLCELVRQFKLELKTPYKLRMPIGITYHAEPPVHVIYTPIA